MTHLTIDAVRRIEEQLAQGQHGNESSFDEELIATELDVPGEVVREYLKLRKQVLVQLQAGNLHPIGIAQKCGVRSHLCIYECLSHLTKNASYQLAGKEPMRSTATLVLPLELDEGEAELIVWHINHADTDADRTPHSLANLTMIHVDRIRAYLNHKAELAREVGQNDDTWLSGLEFRGYKVRPGGPVWPVRDESEDVVIELTEADQLTSEQAVEFGRAPRSGLTLARLLALLVLSALLCLFASP